MEAMKEKKIQKIDFSRKRLARLADDYYNEGKYLSALRFAHRELLEFGGDADVYARLCDIYEGMGLQGSAINYWFRYLDVAEEEELPDIYEGLAVNFLSIGNERQSAYYYNLLVDADDTLPEETKMDIANAFSEEKRKGFRFVYPPALADYSKEISFASKLLKAGDSKRAVSVLEEVTAGSKQYASAKEMQAVAYLLEGNAQKAEEVCKALLEEEPDCVRVLATLAAVYLEQGKKEESYAIAVRLAAIERLDEEDIYKVATVCCENGLHEAAYEKFALLDTKTPYDGRMLYFKGVAAYNCGKLQESIDALDELVTVYPDAEVAKYYLQALRGYQIALREGGKATPPELTYFYHLPQAEREERCANLLKISSCPKDEAPLFGLLALHDGYFAWCFDEMDGGDRDLQYLGLVTAAHVRADEFLQDVLLDFEVADVLKIETLRMLIERNEDMDIGVVLCNLYRRVCVRKLQIGRKKRKKFIEGYARVLSKFGVVDERYCGLLQCSAELLYGSLERANALDLAENPDDIACAIYFLSDIHDLGKDRSFVASAFDANLAKVNALLSYPLFAGTKTTEEEENEMD